LATTGHLFDAPCLDARLVHVDKEEADAAMRFRSGVGAGQQEALVRVVRTARPGLLSVQDPFAVAPLGPGAQTGEVAAGVGLAEALAEDELAAQDLLDVSRFLPVRSQRSQRRRQQRHAEPAQDSRRSGGGHLLLVDRLHDGRRAPATGLLGPAELEPAT